MKFSAPLLEPFPSTRPLCCLYAYPLPIRTQGPQPLRDPSP